MKIEPLEDQITLWRQVREYKAIIADFQMRARVTQAAREQYARSEALKPGKIHFTVVPISKLKRLWNKLWAK